MNQIILYFSSYLVRIRTFYNNSCFSENNKEFISMPTKNEIVLFIDSFFDQTLLAEWGKQILNKHEETSFPQNGIEVSIYYVYKESSQSTETFSKLFECFYWDPEYIKDALPSIRMKNIFGDHDDG